MSDRHEHLDEGTIHAWLDGALSPDESPRVESMAAACDECAARVAEARGLIAASSRILSSLDAVPGGVIPGTNAGNDQLAALRARRQAGSRRWWVDRRIVVAASLVLLAGVSRAVWQSTNGRMLETPSAMVDAVKSTEPAAVDAAPSTLPVSAPSAAGGGAGAREPGAAASVEAKVQEQAMVTADPAPRRRTADAPEARRTSAAAANELRRLDSLVITGTTGTALPRSDSTIVAQTPPPRLESQARQQALGGAARQAQLGFSRDTAARPAAPPASFGERMKLSPIVPTGVAPSRADAIAVSCHVLRTLAGVDTVRLLNQQVPVLSDPAWFRAVASGALRDSTLAWRTVDTVTVELRRANGADSMALRFAARGGVPDVRGLSGVQALVSSRLNCP